MGWGTDHDASLDKLHQVQGSLTVGLIMVPRSGFTTCTPTDTAADIQRRNPLNFSYFPVEHDDRILGLYRAERWFGEVAPDSPVGDDFQPLSEDILIAADASIFDFIKQADTNPTNLVVSGSRVAGLVSLSDIQQLPVRAALFSAITSFEMAMAIAIETHWPIAAEWIAELKAERQDRLDAELQKSRQGDTALSEIAYTQFCDKKSLIVKSGISKIGRNKLEQSLGRIERLRDALAHANQFASDMDEAKKVCSTVRNLYEIKAAFLEYVDKSRTLKTHD